jgi:mRNA interferase MazF
MKRGEIWIVTFDPVEGHEQAGRRPALIISVEAFNDSPAGLVTVLPITSKPRRLPSRIRIAPPEGGLSMESWVITEQVRTISKRRLIARLGPVTTATLGSVTDSVKMLLGLD